MLLPHLKERLSGKLILLNRSKIGEVFVSHFPFSILQINNTPTSLEISNFYSSLSIRVYKVLLSYFSLSSSFSNNLYLDESLEVLPIEEGFCFTFQSVFTISDIIS